MIRLAIVLLLALAGVGHANPFGPAVRDADGRFVNLAGPIARAGPAVTVPFFARRVASNLFGGHDGAPTVVANDGAFLRWNALHSAPTVTWIGHATLLVQLAHVTILTDPIWSDTASPISWLGPKRYVPPGLALDALPAIDAVVISHNHYDHLDVATLVDLARRNPSTRFLVPLGNAGTLRDAGITNVEELDWGQTTAVGAATIHCLPAQHWSQRGLGDTREALWASWAIVGPATRFYFAGDTGYAPHFAAIGEALGPFDLAAVPIGAYAPRKMMQSFHMDPEEAVRAGRDLRAAKVVGMHYGTFDLTDEPPDEPPRRFHAAAPGAGYAADDVWTLPIGGTRTF
jgi:N-acyl-phosphatidylethanolamine-hydrolysing phospholipase D